MIYPRRFASRNTAILLLAAVLLCSCAAPEPSPVQQAANTLVGQPIAVAEKAFGPASTSNPGSAYGGGLYFWNHTTFKPTRVLVQTGVRYAGSAVVGVQPVGVGPNGPVMGPVYQDQYEPVGHYETRPGVDYLCDVIINTNAKDIIQKVLVAGCTGGVNGR